MPSFKPEVNPASEFLEISSDFGNPKEIVREAISNSFDAGANEISASVLIDKSTGEDELVISIEDDGEGMTEKELRYFFGLGFTNRVALDAYGNKISEAIGEKGHGTKIYFNSRRIEVSTVRNGKQIEAYLDNPKRELRKGNVPDVTYEITSSSAESGTKVTIRGYNNNRRAGFSHKELKDYIYWFTKFGSFETAVGKKKPKNVTLTLSGLGGPPEEGEKLEFGHPFPKQVTDIRKLRKLDYVEPLDHYVARWCFPKEPLIGMPGAHLDFVFYIEGDKAKRTYNEMIHEKWATWLDGQYYVGDRYGLWLCRDYIPIERQNSWVAEKTEWTKYHAFVNCQEFRLTANRGDLGNTPKETMDAIEKTVRSIFENRIKSTPKFQKYRQELEREKTIRTAKKEEEDFQSRRKLALNKKVAKLGELELFEPRQESGVFSIILQLLAVKPELFDFKVIDYDTSLGYDLLVTRDYALDLERAAMNFVEMKYELKRDFDHSFKRLAAVICWDTKLANEDEVRDIVGAKRTMMITPPSDENSYTKYMLVSATEPHNIEVIVLKDFLSERLELEFRPRTGKISK